MNTKLSCPKRADVAKQLLSAPATSTSSERVFSACGAVFTERRCRLTTANLEKLCYSPLDFCRAVIVPGDQTAQVYKLTDILKSTVIDFNFCAYLLGTEYWHFGFFFVYLQTGCFCHCIQSTGNCLQTVPCIF